MEINLSNFIKHKSSFLAGLNNNILSCEEKILKSEYIANKSKYSNEDKKVLKHKIKKLRGGKIEGPFFDTYSYILAELYDIESDKNKKKIKKHFVNKLQQTGGTGTLEALDLAKSKIMNEDEKKKANEILLNFTKLTIADAIEKELENFIVTGPMIGNITEISKELNNMSGDEIHKLTDQQTMTRLLVHLGKVATVKTHGHDDVKSIIDHFNSHSLLALMHLNGVVKEINKMSNEQPNFMSINGDLKKHKTNLIAVIGKVTTINDFIKQATDTLKIDKDYNIYPLDVKIVHSKFLKEKYGNKPEYYVNTDAIKHSFSQIPESVQTIVAQIQKRAEEAGKKVPGVASDVFTTIKNVESFYKLFEDLKINKATLNLKGGGDETELNKPVDMLTSISASQEKNVLFSTTVNTRKETSILINDVGQYINQLDTKIAELVDTIEYFNLNESREHYFSYVMANLALNANNRRKYKYMSFGVLDFYKSIIDTIYKKINYDRRGEEKIVGNDVKYLFFYHYHFKIIKKLKLFLDKFYQLKNLNIFYTNNTFIEIAECTGKVKENLSLLNIYKYLLDDFYSKIGLGKSTSNVSVYLRINDFPREKLLLGRQYGMYYKNSQIDDKATNNNGTFIYNVELLNQNNIKYIIRSNNQDVLLKKIKKIANEKLEPEGNRMQKMYTLMNDENFMFNWQQQAGAYTNRNKPVDVDQNYNFANINDYNLPYVGKDENGQNLFTDENERNIYVRQIAKSDNLSSEIKYTLKSDNPKLEDFYKERERKRFFLVNRKVPKINDNEYTKESLDPGNQYKINFDLSGILPAIDLTNYNTLLEPNNNTSRPYIAKIVFLPLLKILTADSIKNLGLQEMDTDFKKQYLALNAQTLEYSQKISFFDENDKTKVDDTNEKIIVNFNDVNSCIDYYINFMNNKKIIYPFMIGFKLYSIDGKMVELGLKVDKNAGTYNKYKNKFIGMKINSFEIKKSDNINSLDNDYNAAEAVTLNPTIDSNPENDLSTKPIKAYHYILKKYFTSLFYEQTEDFRDESEMIFSSSQDDKKLVIDSTEKCRRLLDRYTNEDDVLALAKGTIGSSMETPFNHVFSSEKTPDNESIAMFMSIPSKLSMGNGFMLLTFGYSGTGKSFTIFGNGTDRGILQTTLNEVEIADDEIYFRCYELYGIGFPYANYWYDKIDEFYDPHRVELLIHHIFNNDGSSLIPDKEHVFDDPKLKKLYLNNNNWFFPDAGMGKYKQPETNTNNGEHIEFEEEDIPPPDFNDSTYVGTADNIHKSGGANSWLPYVKYNKETDKKYFTPRVYSKYENNMIDELNNIGIYDTTGNVYSSAGTKTTFKAKKGDAVKTSTGSDLHTVRTAKFGDMKKKYILGDKPPSTYTKITQEQVMNFDKLVTEIDKKRKSIDKTGNTVDFRPEFYNDIKSAPNNFRHIRRIKETANNPESSRSIVFYEFVIKLKEPKQVTITDEFGRNMSVWRQYVTLLIVDLPGQEDIKTSFVEKPEYNVTRNHEPVFNKDTLDDLIKTKSNKMFFTYREQGKNEYKNTNDDPDVYRYNEFYQKMIKSTLYMNPLFKFMTKQPTEDFKINIDDVNTDFLLFNNWSRDGIPKIPSTNLLIEKGTPENNFKKLVKLNSVAGNTRGSNEYRNNSDYILNGLRLYQMDPFDFLLKYVFDDIDDKVKALSPYEGYMINENVGSLITYLYDKTQLKKDRKISNIKTQQHNFAQYLLSNNRLPMDINELNDPKSEFMETDTIKKILISDPNLLPNDKNEISQVNDRNTGYANYRVGNIYDVYKYHHSISVSSYNLSNLYPLDNINNEINTGLPDKTDEAGNVEKTKIDHSYSSTEYKDNTENIKTNHDAIKKNGFLKTKTPGYFSSDLSDKNYTSIAYTIQDKSGTQYKLRDIKTMWQVYVKYNIKYIFYIEIFLIIKKLRGIDVYFRNKTMKHLKGNVGKIVSGKKQFSDNLEELINMYNYYIENVIKYTGDTSGVRGIYNKDYLFRNGEVNAHLKNMDCHFYRNRSDNKIYISNKDNDEADHAELEMLNKKPLIYSYLEPYEPFFNTYSLLYVVSNNDPHIKCYKQMEMLVQNDNFLKQVTTV